MLHKDLTLSTGYGYADYLMKINSMFIFPIDGVSLMAQSLGKLI